MRVRMRGRALGGSLCFETRVAFCSSDMSGADVWTGAAASDGSLCFGTQAELSSLDRSGADVRIEAGVCASDDGQSSGFWKGATTKFGWVRRQALCTATAGDLLFR